MRPFLWFVAIALALAALREASGSLCCSPSEYAMARGVRADLAAQWSSAEVPDDAHAAQVIIISCAGLSQGSLSRLPGPSLAAFRQLHPEHSSLLCRCPQPLSLDIMIYVYIGGSMTP